MTHSTVLHDYRGAIALNNMGIKMLECGCYRQAMLTFKDAMEVFRTLFRPAEASRSNIDAKLRQAYQGLADSQQKQETTPTFSFRVVTGDDRFTNIASVLQQVGPAHFLVRFEPVDFCCPTQRNIDLDSAIVLYNYGISKLCLASAVSATRASSALSLRGAALKVFQLAQCILSSQQQGCEDDTELSLIYFVAALVLDNVGQLLAGLGRHAEAAACHSTLTEVRSALYESEMADLFQGNKVAASAA